MSECEAHLSGFEPASMSADDPADRPLPEEGVCGRDAQATDTSPDLRSVDDLEKSIVCSARKMNSFCYTMLVDIREFDERRGWLRSCSTGCGQWLHWRCDIGLSAAREHVRVAHALKSLPLISAEFATG